MRFTVTRTSGSRAVTTVEGRVRRAMANAINRTLEETQHRTRQLLHQRLTVRSANSAQHLESLVKFERFDRATPEKLIGQMGLQDSGTGTKRRSAQLLIQLTRGDASTRPASSPFFIPTTGAGGIRPRPPAVIPRNLYPSALRLADTRFTINDPKKQKRRNPKTGTVRVMGKRRSFAIDPEFHRPKHPATLGVWQRQGNRDASSTRFLWLYRLQRRLPKKLPFLETAQREVRARWPINLRGFLASEARRALTSPNRRRALGAPVNR